MGCRAFVRSVASALDSGRRAAVGADTAKHRGTSRHALACPVSGPEVMARYRQDERGCRAVTRWPGGRRLDQTCGRALGGRAAWSVCGVLATWRAADG